VEEGREGGGVTVVLLKGYAVMKEESTLIWVPKEMPFNVSGDGERCVEALTLFTCLKRFGEHWGGNRVSAPESTSAECAGIMFVGRWRGRRLWFLLFCCFLGFGSTVNIGW